MEHDAPATEAPRRPAASSGLGPGLVVVIALGAAALGGGVVFLATGGGTPAAEPGASALAPAPVKRAPLFQCPMHPTITSDHPGDCPICGMKLVEVKREQSPSAGEKGPAVDGLAVVTIDPARQQLIGLHTAKVTLGPVAGSWRTVGRVQIDPTRVRRTNVKIGGYVEHVFVDFVGRPVRKGEPLFSLYSPELLSAQNEYLLAVETRDSLAKSGALADSGESLVKAARRKLELWDISAAELERLTTTHEARRAITFFSPSSGVVTAKDVVVGARLEPGATPYEITDLSMVWVMADAYESDLARVRVGMPATLSLQAYPAKKFTGKVEFIDPLLDPKSRTAKVHMHFGNATGELMPELFGEVELQGASREGLRIPSDAVIRAGTLDVVFLARGDGKFEPRAVELGVKHEELVEVKHGLEVGQEVVTRANFLVDSESQLRSSLAGLGAKGP